MLPSEKTPEAPMSDPKEEKAVQAVLEQVWAHFAAQNPSAMLDLLHETCTIWDIFQPQLVKKSSMTEYVAADFDQSAARGTLTYEMTDFVIDVWGDVALARFYLTYDYEAPNPTAGKGRITVVLRRFPEGWRCVHVHEGQIPGGIPPVSTT
jgi:ketosteroid isomerase-like protein